MSTETTQKLKAALSGEQAGVGEAGPGLLCFIISFSIPFNF